MARSGLDQKLYTTAGDGAYTTFLLLSHLLCFVPRFVYGSHEDEGTLGQRASIISFFFQNLQEKEKHRAACHGIIV